MDTDCVFCKIISGQLPSSKVYEDDNFLAFFDISQFTPGHTLVIPKIHVECVWDVQNFSEYLAVVNKIANHYRSIGYKYVDSLVFGRGVNHAHIQLVPHNNDDKEWSQALQGLEFFSGPEHIGLTEAKANLLLARFSLIDKK